MFTLHTKYTAHPRYRSLLTVKRDMSCPLSYHRMQTLNEGALRKVDIRLPRKREFNLPWREAGPLNHLDDKVDSNQQVVNKELSPQPSCGTNRL